LHKGTISREISARTQGEGRSEVMWFAGIDWADTHHDAVVIDAAGQRVGAIRVSHNAAGLAKLVVFLRGIGDGDSVTDPDRLACIRLVAG